MLGNREIAGKLESHRLAYSEVSSFRRRPRKHPNGGQTSLFPLISCTSLHTAIRCIFLVHPTWARLAAWSGLRNALSRLFCASLGSLDSRRTLSPTVTFPLSGSTPTFAPHELRHASLPSENVCTENLTPFLKLLSCKGHAGLATLTQPTLTTTILRPPTHPSHRPADPPPPRSHKSSTTPHHSAKYLHASPTFGRSATHIRRRHQPALHYPHHPVHPTHPSHPPPNIPPPRSYSSRIPHPRYPTPYVLQVGYSHVSSAQGIPQDSKPPKFSASTNSFFFDRSASALLAPPRTQAEIILP
ncbi:Gpi16-domain-containing protein [Suillus brevipes Sb2]|nr:Gpi16-domain-containing protein [Suillus brevipes Sb2]